MRLARAFHEAHGLLCALAVEVRAHVALKGRIGAPDGTNGTSLEP